MEYEELQRLLGENRQAIGRREAELPGIYQSYSPSTDPEIAQTRSAQAEKVKQLFQHDSQLAQTTFQPQAAPGPTVGGGPAATPDPMIIDPTIGLRSANTQTMSTAQEAIDLGQQISKRKDYLGESLDKALKLFQIGMQIKEAESAAIQGEMDNWFKMQDLIEKRNNGKKGDTDKALKEKYRQILMSGGEAGSLDTLTQQQFLGWVQRVAGQNPQDIGVIQEVASELAPIKATKQEVFPYNEDTAAAGLVGQPVNGENQQRLSALIQWKTEAANAVKLNNADFPSFEDWYSQRFKKGVSGLSSPTNSDNSAEIKGLRDKYGY